MQAAARPAALLFDMDGLLLDTERPIYEAFVEFADSIGLPDAEALGLSMIGMSAARCREHLGAALPPPVGLDWAWAQWNARADGNLANSIPVKPGAAEVLADLSSAGWRMVVVTSTRTRRARDHLDRAGLLDHFLDVVGGDSVPATKPDPAPYVIGAERAGARSSDCVAFEDSDTGVSSALAAGCQVHQIPDIRPPGQPVPLRGQAVHDTLRAAVTAAQLLD